MHSAASDTGPTLVLDHLLELAAVSALLLLCLSLGLTLLERAGWREPRRPLGDLLSALLLGIGGYASVLLLLGLSGFIGPWGLLLATAGVVLALGSQIGSTWKLLSRCAGLVRTRWDLVALVGIGLVTICLLIQSSAPPTDWDSLIYHLEVPRAWLAEGEIHLPPDNVHAAYTGIVHLLYLPFLVLGAPSAAATVNAIVACLLALALFEFGDRHFDRRSGRIASLALFGSPAVIFVAVTPRVDVTLTLFLVAGLYCTYSAVFSEDRDGQAHRRQLYLAAALLGLATSVKLLAVPWIIATAPLGLWASARLSSDPRQAARLATICSIVFLIGAAPGAILRWELSGAPLYPYLSSRLLEPWLQPWFGASLVPPDAVLEPRSAFTREPFSVSALLTDPGRLTPEREGGLYILSPILWLAPLALLRLRKPRETWLFVVAGIFLAVVLARGARTNLRYLIPAVAVLTLAASHLLVWAYGKVGSNPPVRILAGIVVFFAIAPSALPFAFRWSEMPTLRHVVGTVSSDQYLTQNEDPDVYHWARTSRWLEARLGREDRVLMLFEGRGFYLEIPKIQDNLMANWPLLAQRRQSGECLSRAGFTHVLVNYGVLDVHMSHGMPATSVAWPEFSRFARECLTRQAVRAPYALYSVTGRAYRNRAAGDAGEAEDP